MDLTKLKPSLMKSSIIITIKFMRKLIIETITLQSNRLHYHDNCIQCDKMHSLPQRSKHSSYIG
jgi:hypothetical protein